MATTVRTDRGAGTDMVPLRSLPDWRVAEGDPDIRGWEVFDTSGEKIGQIDDLLINTTTGEAVYAVIAYGGSLGIGTKRALLPIDDLQLDLGNKQAICHYSVDALKAAPEYEEGRVDYSSVSGYWAGVAAAEARGQQQERRTVLQRLVHPEQPQQSQQPQQDVGQTTRRVRVYVGRRSADGSLSDLNNGDVIDIPLAGAKTNVLDEIFIRLEALEEDEGREKHRFRM